jgi:hypothetical protein
VLGLHASEYLLSTTDLRQFEFAAQARLLTAIEQISFMFLLSREVLFQKPFSILLFKFGLRNILPFIGILKGFCHLFLHI